MTNPLDPATEASLRSAAVWETPSTETPMPTSASSPNRRWMVALAAAAAAVVLIIALIPRETPDWELDIVAGPSTGAWGDILGFNEPTETRLVLNIYDLPPAETGTFYEVWWVRDSGEAVSSGSFLGSDTIDMWMGIRRSEFPEMLITIEPSDGNPAPSDTIVARSAP